MKRLRRIFELSPVVLAGVASYFLCKWMFDWVTSFPHGKALDVQISLLLLNACLGAAVGVPMGKLSGYLMVQRMNREDPDWWRR